MGGQSRSPGGSPRPKRPTRWPARRWSASRRRTTRSTVTLPRPWQSTTICWLGSASPTAAATTTSAAMPRFTSVNMPALGTTTRPRSPPLETIRCSIATSPGPCGAPGLPRCGRGAAAGVRARQGPETRCARGPGYFNLEGIALFEAERYHDAIDRYGSAMEWTPEDDVLYWNLASAWARIKTPGTIMPSLEHAVTAITRA